MALLARNRLVVPVIDLEAYELPRRRELEVLHLADVDVDGGGPFDVSADPPSAKTPAEMIDD